MPLCGRTGVQEERNEPTPKDGHGEIEGIRYYAPPMIVAHSPIYDSAESRHDDSAVRQTPPIPTPVSTAYRHPSHTGRMDQPFTRQTLPPIYVELPLDTGPWANLTERRLHPGDYQPSRLHQGRVLESGDLSGFFRISQTGVRFLNILNARSAS